jgi:hypothetical protein
VRCGGGTLASPWAGQPTVPAPRRPHRAPSHLGLPHTCHAGERSAATTRSRGVRSSSNTIQIRRVARQTKPMQQCHPERSEGSLAGPRSFAALRMTKRDGLFFEMDCGQADPLRSTWPGRRKRPPSSSTPPPPLRAWQADRAARRDEPGGRPDPLMTRPWHALSALDRFPSDYSPPPEVVSSGAISKPRPLATRAPRSGSIGYK